MIRLAALLLLMLASPLRAEQMTLAPSETVITLRLYAFGVMPLDGNFTRFDGGLTYDPARRGVCRVELHIDAASLVMSSTDLTDQVTGPDFMDVAHYPALTFSGTCQSGHIDGVLTMRGVAHPFILDIDPQKSRVIADGRLRRAEWGMTARPLIGGPTVRIQVSVPRQGGMQF